MKINGIEIRIVAGEYEYPDNDDEPATLKPHYIEHGEITLTAGTNKIPVMEIAYMARKMALKIQEKQSGK